MSDILDPKRTRPFTDEELGAIVTEAMDQIAGLPESMFASKQIASVLAAHANADGVLDVPVSVLQLELMKVIGILEARIVAIEAALGRAGIELPDTVAKARETF